MFIYICIASVNDGSGNTFFSKETFLKFRTLEKFSKKKKIEADSMTACMAFESGSRHAQINLKQKKIKNDSKRNRISIT